MREDLILGAAGEPGALEDLIKPSGAQVRSKPARVLEEHGILANPFENQR